MVAATTNSDMEPHGELLHAWLQDFQLRSIRIQPGAHTNGKDRVRAKVTKVIGFQNGEIRMFSHLV